MSTLNRIPISIPDSRTKQSELKNADIEHIYLGQGLMFVPPLDIEEEYNQYVVAKELNPDLLPLSAIQQVGKPGDVYNSAVLDNEWKKLQEEQYVHTHRAPEAFGGFVHNVSKQTIATIYEIDADSIATTQVDNLMQALETVQMTIPKITNGKPLSKVFLPEKYMYSGHREFIERELAKGVDIQIIAIPEVQIDGSQDIEAIAQLCSDIESNDSIALWIDQEHNNNASGFDRNTSRNADIVTLLQQYVGCVFYFGDNAYKGMKEPLVGGYDLQKKLINAGVTAFFNTSFSKIGNYRGTPSYKSTLSASTGELSDANTLQSALNSTQRGRGIGCTADGAMLMNRLVQNADFAREVAVLNLYLQFTRDSIAKDLSDTGLETLFGTNTSGIFRCLPSDITAVVNSGNTQVVTVGDRINIWPLGDKKIRKVFLKALQYI